MATGKKFYWIKLTVDFMTSDTVDYLMSLPNGANYVVLYQMLCLKTINTEGRLSRQIGEVIIPYDAEKIQRDCKWFSLDTVRVAMELYRNFHLIYEDMDGVLTLANHNKMVGSETDYAIQKANQRNKQLPSVDNVHSDVHENVHIEIRDKENRDIEIRDKENRDKIIDNKESVETLSRERIPYQEIVDKYNSICVSLPKVVTISDTRKKLIAARYKQYDMEIIENAFYTVEESNFLCGREKQWSASFDWIMNSSNFIKIIEGNYKNKTVAKRTKSDEGYDTMKKWMEEFGNDQK